ncbi:MAG: hypothetical protein PHE27_05595 [Alphaproteobacteria bacterium]|nr:hypothetical protein [Alphaproteobacteria bacterium]
MSFMSRAKDNAPRRSTKEKEEIKTGQRLPEKPAPHTETALPAQPPASRPTPPKPAADFPNIPFLSSVQTYFRKAAEDIFASPPALERTNAGAFRQLVSAVSDCPTWKRDVLMEGCGLIRNTIRTNPQYANGSARQFVHLLEVYPNESEVVRLFKEFIDLAANTVQPKDFQRLTQSIATAQNSKKGRAEMIEGANYLLSKRKDLAADAAPQILEILNKHGGETGVDGLMKTLLDVAPQKVSEHDLRSLLAHIYCNNPSTERSSKCKIGMLILEARPDLAQAAAQHMETIETEIVTDPACGLLYAYYLRTLANGNPKKFSSSAPHP